MDFLKTSQLEDSVVEERASVGEPKRRGGRCNVNVGVEGSVVWLDVDFLQCKYGTALAWGRLYVRGRLVHAGEIA